MTCRHAPGDPSCSSSASAMYQRLYPPVASTPDSKNFEIVDVNEVKVGGHSALVLTVKYPNCAKCAYEGTKILVYLDTGILDVVFWKEIDPHFADPKTSAGRVRAAPSPDARFPASPQGREHALTYAELVCRTRDEEDADAV